MMETKTERKPDREQNDGPSAASSGENGDKPNKPNQEANFPNRPDLVEAGRLEQREKATAETKDRPSPRAALGDGDK